MARREGMTLEDGTDMLYHSTWTSTTICWVGTQKDQDLFALFQNVIKRNDAYNGAIWFDFNITVAKTLSNKN